MTGPARRGRDPSRELGSALPAARRHGRARRRRRRRRRGRRRRSRRAASRRDPAAGSVARHRAARAHVAPGTFKVTLEVDGAADRVAHVRGPRRSRVVGHAAQHKAREAFVMEVMEMQAKVETLAADLRTRRAAATGDEATRLQALETAARRRRRRTRRRAVAARQAAGARAAGASAAGGADQRVRRLRRAHRHDDARRPGTMRAALAEAKADLAAIEKRFAR